MLKDIKVGDEVFVFICGFRVDKRTVTNVTETQVTLCTGESHLLDTLREKFQTTMIMKCEDYLNITAEDIQRFRDYK